ncbi:uncharacterized protein VP01_172g10 [Puccinia sorghi]|uniref:Uncharacterized protein n=1 Tax=Puccinia sorghi TaxID=27349 RepID=A0A0L6VFE0_9BASI|nr:uncharacterized protein VP01_172g10 [Puccinia sorghi]
MSCTTICVLVLGLVTTSLSSPHSSRSSSSSGSTSVPPTSGGGNTLKCTRYSGIKGPNPTCNDDRKQVCSGGCTGAIVASQCKKEGDPSTQAVQLMCTISYSQPSLDRGVCVNEQGTFVCQGIPEGEATCTGCALIVGDPSIVNSSSPDPPTAPGMKTPSPSSSTSPATPLPRKLALFLVASKLLGLLGLLALFV